MNTISMNPDGTVEEVRNISMNLQKGRQGRTYHNHVAEMIKDVEELYLFESHCSDNGYAVMDRSDSHVFPKFAVMPDVAKIAEGDLIRVYNTTNYPVHKSCLDWRGEYVPSRYYISENDLDELLSDLGEFVNRDEIRSRFKLC